MTNPLTFLGRATPPINKYEIELRVRNSVDLLDERFGTPKWDERIDLDRLQVSSSVRCVLGQLYGSYGSAPHELIISGRRTAFAGGTDVDDEWRHVINARRAARRADRDAGPPQHVKAEVDDRVLVS